MDLRSHWRLILFCMAWLALTVLMPQHYLCASTHLHSGVVPPSSQHVLAGAPAPGSTAVTKMNPAIGDMLIRINHLIEIVLVLLALLLLTELLRSRSYGKSSSNKELEGQLIRANQALSLLGSNQQKLVEETKESFSELSKFSFRLENIERELSGMVEGLKSVNRPSSLPPADPKPDRSPQSLQSGFDAFDLEDPLGRSLPPPSVVTSEGSAQAAFELLASGDRSGPRPLFLNTDASSSPIDMIQERAALLKEVEHTQGSFVMFVDSTRNRGWMFPNPLLIYRKDVLRRAFPDLTEHQFTHAKHTIKPVRTRRQDEQHWKIQ